MREYREGLGRDTGTPANDSTTSGVPAKKPNDDPEAVEAGKLSATITDTELGKLARQKELILSQLAGLTELPNLKHLRLNALAVGTDSATLIKHVAD